ncbi:Transmembrane protein [Paraburkholderia sacchari]|uniref:hypothetical protein n=1 Tax=Paraburkholderia sacchari TaxID=159450 RepID=UPI0039A4061A
MRRIALFVLGILGFVACVSSVSGKEPGRVLRDDCHLSFLVPNGLEYIEMDDFQVAKNDECYIAFKYVGDLKIKSRPDPPSTAEDWRWLTDFALTVESTSLDEGLAKIKSAVGLEQNGMFRLVSNEHFLVPGGEMYVLHYLAVKPTKNMIRLNEEGVMIFIAGNDSRSVSYVQYTGGRLREKDKKKAAIYRNLFSSFRFFD